MHHLTARLAALAAVTAVALAALTGVASAATTVYPAGHSFSLGGSPGLTFETPQGVCTFLDFTGTVPNAPANKALTVNVPLTMGKAGTCAGGGTATATGWSLGVQVRAATALNIPAGGVALRYPSYPFCKVDAGALAIPGFLASGVATPPLMFALFAAQGSFTGQWVNDGGSCFVSGVPVNVKVATGPWAVGAMWGMLVKDTTDPTQVIQVGQ